MATSLTLDTEPLSRLVAMGYEAPIRFGNGTPGGRRQEAAAWHAFAAEAARAFGCQLALVEYHDHANPGNNFIAAGGLDGFEEVFAGARARNDEDNYFKGMRVAPPGTVRLGSELVSPEQMHRSRSYAALAMPWHLEHFLIAKITGNGTGAAYFSLGRTAREAPFAEDDKALLGRHVVAHLARSFTLQRELAAMRSVTTHLPAAMEQAASGIVLFDIQGRPVLVNQKAAEIFARRDGLCLAGGELRAEAVDAQSLLALALASAIAIARGQALPPPAAVLVKRPAAVQPYRVQFSLLKPLDGSHLAPGAVVVALIHDDQRTAGPTVPAVFRATYGLTRAEVSLCEALLAGRSLADAAARLGVKRNTAKTHLARVFDKTGVRSQVALLRLLALGSRT